MFSVFILKYYGYALGFRGSRSNCRAPFRRHHEKNVQKLLAALDGISEGHRNAQFRCVIVALRHKYDSEPLVCHGEWAGRITNKPYGSSGFGYDPVFFDPQLCVTAAELPLEIKNQVSHRAVALAKLLKKLEME